MPTIHKLLAGYEITLSTADSSASLHMADNSAIGANISSGSVTYGPYYYETEWVSDGGTIAIAKTTREIGDAKGIAIDGDSSVHGNIYESGIVKEMGLYLAETGLLVAQDGAFYSGATGERLSPNLTTDGLIALAAVALVVDSTIEPNPTDAQIKLNFDNYPTFLDYYWYKEDDGYDPDTNPTAKTLVCQTRQFIPATTGMYWFEIYARNDFGVSEGFCSRTTGHFEVTEE